MKNKPWYISSKGTVCKATQLGSPKHLRRMNWGNAFVTEEEAKLKMHLFKVINNSDFEVINKKTEAVEPDATSGEECCNFCIGVRGCNQPDCPCHSKQPPEALRMPDMKSSDERRDNPHSDLKLPENLPLPKSYPEIGLHQYIFDIAKTLNELLDFLALQKEG